MQITVQHNNRNYQVDLTQPIDITLPIQTDEDAASAWYCPPTSIEPVMTEHFVGDVNQGGAVNFRNISFNPHGNGTHTECVGHISKEFYSIQETMQRFFFMAQLVSITPTTQGEDQVITTEQIKAIFDVNFNGEAFLIRTLPNTDQKRTCQYTETNPPYIEATAMDWLYQQGIRHFLIDTPSVDRESDDGVLAAHHAYWNYPANPRLDATITELIYVPNAVEDGYYWLNLQMAAVKNDAAPSQPTLYAINETN